MSGNTRLAYLDFTEEARAVPSCQGGREASTSQSRDTDAVRPSAPRLFGASSSIIAFNARDALTNAPLIDPVLGSDGLIHDRWALLESTEDLAKSITM